MNGFNEYKENQLTTINVRSQKGIFRIQLARHEKQNSINDTMVRELHRTLLDVEKDQSISVLIIEGDDNYFCSGMDFISTDQSSDSEEIRKSIGSYYDILDHLTKCSKVVICKVDGIARAGGIGLLSASDIVIASKNASFSLSEMIFGLIPANVLPFLIRKIGFHKAKLFSLTTQTFKAQQAVEAGLVDEFVEDTNEALRRILIKVQRLDVESIKRLKQYMNGLLVSNFDTRSNAIETLHELVSTDKIRHNIERFTRDGKFPWQ